MRWRIANAALASVLLTAALAAPGGIAGVGGAAAASTGGGTLLARTLLAVSDDAVLGGNFEFGDVATQQSLAGVPASGYTPGAKLDQRWEQILGIGALPYTDNEVGPYASIAINPFAVDVALTVGEAPHDATEVQGGIHPAALRAALVKLGAKPAEVAGRSGLAWGAEGSVHLNGVTPLGVGIGALGEYDRTVIGADSVVSGRYVAQVADLLGIGAGGGATLAKNQLMVATVACLGDVIAAYGLYMDGIEIAVGVLRPKSATAAAIEVMCATPYGQSHSAAALGTAARSALAPGTTNAAGRQLRPLFASSSVAVGSAGSASFARVTATDVPQQPAGAVFTLVHDGQLPALFGLS